MRDTALGCKDNDAAHVKINPPRWLSVDFANQIGRTSEYPSIGRDLA